MRRVDMFSFPVYEFDFSGHYRYKDEWVEYIQNDKFIEDDVIHFTNPNLHRNPTFQPLVTFATECMKKVFEEVDMEPSFGFTSMWGTHQTGEGKHHSHTHGNNLFAGVYYVHADEKVGSGTVFENVMADLNPIKLTRKGHSSFERNDEAPKRTSFFNSKHQTEFVEGRLIIFPAFMRHHTLPYKGSKRVVIAMNAMPIGVTNTDPFDRYAYQNWNDIELQGD